MERMSNISQTSLKRRKVNGWLLNTWVINVNFVRDIFATGYTIKMYWMGCWLRQQWWIVNWTRIVLKWTRDLHLRSMVCWEVDWDAGSMNMYRSSLFWISLLRLGKGKWVINRRAMNKKNMTNNLICLYLNLKLSFIHIYIYI